MATYDLSWLNAQPDANEDLDDAYRYARLTPEQQSAMRHRQGQQMVERGVQQAGRAALGLEQPGNKRAKAGEELRALAQRVRPGTADFYKQAVDILTKYEMVAEAEQMAAMGRDLAAQERTATAPTTEIEKLQAARERATKAGNQAAADEITKRIDAITREKTGSAAAPSELGKLIAERNAAAERNDTAAVAAYDAAIAAKQGGKDMTPYQQAQLDIARRRLDLEERKADATATQKQGKLDATAQASLTRSAEQAARVVTFAKRALKQVSNWTAGPVGKAQSFIPGTPAYNLEQDLKTVAANVSFRELQAMRAASPTGGALGQVSDFENRLLQAVEGSLDIGQTPPRLRANLQRIIKDAEALLAAIKQSGGPAPTPAEAPPPASGDARTAPEMRVDPQEQAARDEAAAQVRAGEAAAPPGTDPAAAGAAARRSEKPAKRKWTAERLN